MAAWHATVASSREPDLNGSRARHRAWHHGRVHPSPYGRRPTRSRLALRTLLAPIRRLVRLHPLQSWLVVMVVILGLSMVGLRFLALLVAVGWTAYAVYTWVSPSGRRRIRR
jgi:hypothetical protein